MAYFQYDQFLGGMIQSVDDTIIANAVFETSLPFIALQRLVLDEFPVFPHPFQFVEQARSRRRRNPPQIRLRFGHQDDLVQFHSPISARKDCKSMPSPAWDCLIAFRNESANSGRSSLAGSSMLVSASISCVIHTSRRLSTARSTRVSNSLVDNWQYRKTHFLDF